MLSNVHFIRPDQLSICKDGKKLIIRSKSNEDLHIDQFLCELHQQEILSLPESILEVLVKSRNLVLVNDLRTILIGHDKRFLTLLSQDNFLSNIII